jgi:hypothetical protein
MTAVAPPRANRATHLTRRLGREPPDMSDVFARNERVRDWSLAILRFAVTLEKTDRAIALAMAKDMDRAGLSGRSAVFTFFARTSTEFCDAIADRDDPKRVTTLRRHLGRIDDRRLRRALEAAIEFGGTYQMVRSANKLRKRGAQDLWEGLRRRDIWPSRDE